MHLIIDGYEGDPHRLADQEVVRALLDTVPQAIGMTTIAPSYVCRYEGSKPEDWGISGFVLIAESHLSVHTFPERGLLWADIFSCKSFDADRLMEAVQEAFSLREARATLLGRGLEYSEELTPTAGRAAAP
jgi:S-adenosylmethionine decarboxylase